jgi:hypothetical protein
MSTTFVDDESAFDYYRKLLENLDLKLVLDSPNNEYRFEYYTSCSKDQGTGIETKSRKYRLLDQVRGTVTPEPWDAFNIESHARILRGLTNWSQYRLTLVSGWEVQCSSCGHVMSGKAWQPLPRSCTANHHPRCKQKIDESLATDVCVPLPAGSSPPKSEGGVAQGENELTSI